MITRLTTVADIEEACAQLRKVFHSTHLFRLPFTLAVTHRAVLFPSGYLFNDELVAALVAASHAIGEKTAYYSAVEGVTQDWEHFPVWPELQARLDFRAEVDDALRADGAVDVLEGALYSTQGTWAAVSYEDDYSLVGGPEAFMAVVASMLDIDAMAVGLLKYRIGELKRTARNSRYTAQLYGWWLVNLYEHIYGSSTAERYVHEAGLVPLLYELHAMR